MKIKDIFGDCKIVALAGEKNSGKTNNIVSLVIDFRKENKETAIFVYGFPPTVIDLLTKYDVIEISELKQMIDKQNCILLLDEYQKLHLNDRRNTELLNQFADFVYHNNVYVLLSSPNIREFNSIIGSKIERWVLKTVYLTNCINGSQLKKAVRDYRGRFKKLNSIVVPKDTLLIINNEKEIILKCDYVPEADTKQHFKDLFKPKIVKKLSGKLSKKCPSKVETFKSTAGNQ